MSTRRRLGRTREALKPDNIDFPFLLLTLILLAIGLLMVFSAGSVLGYNSKQNAYYYFFQQLKWALVGGTLAAIITLIPYYTWRKLAGFGIILSIAFLVMVLFSEASVAAKGSARWLDLGFMQIQPSEIAKLALILFYAHMLDRYPVRKVTDAVVPVLVLLVIAALVYKQPDLGTTMVLLATCGAMLLMTELKTRVFIIAIPVIVIPVLYLIRHTPYQWQRILAWLDPWGYASSLGYQITNAQIAFGSGGLFGVGPGRGLQKYGFLPENHTDMIFAVIGEEFGLLGTTVVIGLFMLLFARGYQIARQCPDRFGRLLAFGITSCLAIQTTFNLGVVTGVFPVTGITLPLISYGGSSLIMTLIEIGLILNISRYRQPAVVASPEKTSLSL